MAMPSLLAVILLVGASASHDEYSSKHFRRLFELGKTNETDEFEHAEAPAVAAADGRPSEGEEAAAAATDVIPVAEEVGERAPRTKAEAEEQQKTHTATILTYNGDEGVAEVAHGVYERAARSNANLIVMCQQEAKASLVYEADVPPDWTLVSYAEHWGFTSLTNRNAQILAVLWKSGLSRNGREDRSELINEKKGLVERKYMTDTTVGPVSAITSFHDLTSTGKGGASVLLKGLPGLGDLVFICAHLSSEVDDATRRNEAKALLSGYSSVESVALLGDLNYRIHKPDDIASQGKVILESREAKVAKFFIGSTAKAASFDPLSAKAAINVQASWLQEERMLCNEPALLYMPTYKLGGQQTCDELFLAYASCGDDLTGYCAVQLKQCFASLGRTKMWGGKATDKLQLYRLKDDGKLKFQMGWLDRVCWRGSFQHPLDESLGPTGSDHMPVVFTMALTAQ